jgi:hypothetical protein
MAEAKAAANGEAKAAAYRTWKGLYTTWGGSPNEQHHSCDHRNM